MNYIVLDLEWNQTPNGKGTEVPGLPFEIIEIGAVKLDENFKVISRFSQLIRPQVYKKLHRITKSIIQMEIEDLQYSSTFQQVGARFLKWCDKDYIFCTWGSMDLTELQRNYRYYGMETGWRCPFLYYDLQKIFNLQYDNGDKNMKSLEAAVDQLGIAKKMKFHRASEDAEYTAKLLQRLGVSYLKGNESIDYYCNPKSRKEEFTKVYSDCTEYLSMEFPGKEKLMTDKKLRTTRCIVCGLKIRRTLRWFSANSGTYFCVANCPEHGKMIGKIRVKHTDSDRVFGIREMTRADEGEEEEIYRKKEFIKSKRREKRHRTMEEDK